MDWKNIVSESGSLQRDKRVKRKYTDQHGRVWFSWADKETQQPVMEPICISFPDHGPPWIAPFRFAKFQADTLDFVWDYDAMTDELAGMAQRYYSTAIDFCLKNKLPVPEIGGVITYEALAVLGAPPLSPEIPMAAKAGDKWILGFPGYENVRLQKLLEQGRGFDIRRTMRLIQERVDADQAAQRAADPVYTSDGHGGYKEKPSMNGGVDGLVALDIAPTVNADAVTYRQFFSEAMKRGMIPAEISLAWKAHKENLAEVAA